MSTKIEASLENYMQSKIKFARQLNSVGLSDDACRASLLVLYSEHGFCRPIRKSGKVPIWSPIGSLQEFWSLMDESLILMRLSRRVTPTTRPGSSLSVLMQAFWMHASLLGDRSVTPDMMLIRMAEHEIIQLEIDEDDEVLPGTWRFTRRSADRMWSFFEGYPSFQSWLRKQISKPKLSKAMLEDAVRFHARFKNAANGPLPDPRERWDVALALEMLGVAQPYLTNAGQLAWKAA